jgi:TfoX/Sxy family transcriptional regulator of competence genes
MLDICRFPPIPVDARSGERLRHPMKASAIVRPIAAPGKRAPIEHPSSAPGWPYSRTAVAETTPPEKVELYERLIATRPEVERKGAKFPYTSLNGNMFTILSPPGVLALRLASADREAFLEKYKTGLHESHGTVMKEYVRVPDDLLARTDELKPYLALSYEYAKTLRPKPTTRRAGGR